MRQFTLFLLLVGAAQLGDVKKKTREIKKHNEAQRVGVVSNAKCPIGSTPIVFHGRQIGVFIEKMFGKASRT